MDYLEFVRRVLRDIDAAVADLEYTMISGACQDWTKYRECVARRDGLMKARAICTERLSGDDARELHEFPK